MSEGNMREATMSKEVKKAFRDRVIVPTVAHSETWVWNKCQLK